MFQGRFEGRVAAVTGGCNGIGAAVVERLVLEGARVAIWDMDISARETRVGNLPAGSYACFQVDVSDLASVEAGHKASVEQFGGIDILVNSAGIAGPVSTLADYPPEEWRKVQAINLDGTFFCCRTVVPGMIERNWGRIVNVASVAGKEGNPKASAYSASKAAVIGMTKSLGKELATHNIAVNAIAPAAARTRIFDQVTQEFVDFMLSKIPRERFVEVEEIAAMICWMCSEENSFTTASVFDISGGRATY
ncbi:SDR family NAD(P)-dependent oxidoreductase [Tropicimonas sp. IMCC6043]|uniref:SDR family NAD(P)-dependent oxidoreductase n=1 Tax=Tropicimonas sp. IMCC6043 TaxID=2510645 RepID=UPI00101BF27F|nr:SDR family NAD(P)-dependent oxidoreductase [Tropicimonas sp. IMCC6043]RYH06707.1 SDR family oxidoreductase [Tropicimonas sp. IMCC6043]